jgi:hypothetical protein
MPPRTQYRAGRNPIYTATHPTADIPQVRVAPASGIPASLLLGQSLRCMILDVHQGYLPGIPHLLKQRGCAYCIQTHAVGLFGCEVRIGSRDVIDANSPQIADCYTCLCAWQ